MVSTLVKCQVQHADFNIRATEITVSMSMAYGVGLHASIHCYIIMTTVTVRHRLWHLTA